MIAEYIVDLGTYYGFKVDKDMRFKEFVGAYDELMYTKQCSKSPDECLKYFTKSGDWRNVRAAIRKGADNWNLGLYGAVQGRHIDLIEFFVGKGVNDLNWD